MRPLPDAVTAPLSISATLIRRKSVPSVAILENLCDGFGKTPNCLLQVSPGLEEESYRTPMRIEAVRAYRWDNRFTSFPVCPRCDSTMGGNIRPSATVADSDCRGEAFAEPPFSLPRPKNASFFNGKRPARLGIGAFMC